MSAPQPTQTPKRKTDDSSGSMFSPDRTRSTKAGGPTSAYVTSVTRTPKKAQLDKTTVFQNLPSATDPPRYGTAALDLEEVYGKYTNKSLIDRDGNPFNGLPGIYILTPCSTDAQKPCVSETNKILIKVGNAMDLANRLDKYHTYFPYGFTILRLYVLERAERTAAGLQHAPFEKHQVSSSNIQSMIDTAETHIFRYIHYTLKMHKLVITRPSRSEWFEARMLPAQLEQMLRKVDLFVSTLKLLTPDMFKAPNKPVYGTFYTQCCDNPRFSIVLKELSASDREARFGDMPDRYTVATMVQKTEFPHAVKKAKKGKKAKQPEPILAIVKGQIVDVDGNVVADDGSSRRVAKRLKLGEKDEAPSPTAAAPSPTAAASPQTAAAPSPTAAASSLSPSALQAGWFLGVALTLGV